MREQVGAVVLQALGSQNGRKLADVTANDRGVELITEEQDQKNATPSTAGALLINADDWGRDIDTTDRTLDCVLRGVVSSASAMVFMEDSARSAILSKQYGVDVGLHLNFTSRFSAPQCSPRLLEQQEKLTSFLRASRLAPAIYHPGLAGSFEYVVRAQLDEFERLYAAPPRRVDGHHHMHLCANVTHQALLPPNIIARRNFSFKQGEKGFLNRLYRRRQDRQLAKRHRIADFLFSILPIEEPGRLERIFDLARQFKVELETHPVNQDEYKFLTGGELKRRIGDLAIARGYVLS